MPIHGQQVLRNQNKDDDDDELLEYPSQNQENNMIVPAKRDELELLISDARKVEKQVEALSTCVRQFADDISAETAIHRNLQDTVDKTVQDYGQIRFYPKKHDFGTHMDDLHDRVNDNYLRLQHLRKSKPWLDPSHPDAREAVQKKKELLELLEEQRLAKDALRSQYEQQLNVLRSQLTKMKGEERKQVIEEFEGCVKKYHQLAVDATNVAKRERAKSETEKIRIQQIAESACKSFERDLKDRTKKALDEYRQLAQAAHDAAKRERMDVLNHCNELETAIDHERRQFEAQVFREAEKRVSVYKSTTENISRQLAAIQANREKEMNEFCSIIEQRCRRFEEDLRKKVLQILWDNGIDMEEKELVEAINTVEGVDLRSTVSTRAKDSVGRQPGLFSSANDGVRVNTT